jgi:DNA-binding response OmpR family regulator
VLVIEDEKSCQRMYLRALERAGYGVAVAESAKRGLEIVRERRPDTILLDLNLPDVNGFMAMDILRADPETADVPVLMMTGQDDPSELLKTASVRYDARDFLYKPFTLEELHRRLEKALSGPKAVHTPSMGTVLRRGPLVLDLTMHELRVNGKTRRLGRGQHALLWALMSARGPVSHDQLLRQAWSESNNPSTVKVTVKRLREVLAPINGVEIRTVANSYELVVQSERAAQN